MARRPRAFGVSRLMVEPVRHDWRAVIRNIKRGYRAKYGKTLTDHKLGIMVAGTDLRTVKGWQKGKEPGHYKGNLLLAYEQEFKSVKLETSTTTV